MKLIERCENPYGCGAMRRGKHHWHFAPNVFGWVVFLTVHAVWIAFFFVVGHCDSVK